MTSLCDNEYLIYIPRFMDAEQSPALWWCKDAEDVQAVSINAVSKNPLATWDNVKECEEFINQFRLILIAVPSGPEQEEIKQELSARFSTPLLIPLESNFYGAKSVKELSSVGGQRAIDKLLYGATEVPIYGLINLADVDCTKRLNQQRIVSGFKELDSAIGGFNPGDLSIWTGKRGEGKSTFLGQILLEAINQNHKVCVYSGELPKMQFKLSMLQQAAGEMFVDERVDKQTGRVFYDVPELAVKYIDQWWNKCIFLTDIQCNNAHNEDNIIRIFEYAYRQYRCDVFLVDNIMTAELKDSARVGYYQAQSAFTGRLVAFAKANGVHVHLVAHPRKTDKRLENDDVGGSGDITNRADNVFKVERVKPELVDELGYSMVLTVMKNREFGALTEIKMDFNEKSRRFYPMFEDDDKHYSWEMAMKNDIL